MPSEFFPKTAWDTINDAAIRFGYSEERTHKTGSVRKPSERWKGNIERPRRKVAYIDLSRILPVSGRVGYAKIAKSKHIEASSTPFEVGRLSRLSEILGRPYRAAKMALSNVDKNRLIPVLQRSESYSGYHQGQGETTIAELIQADLPEYSLLLIDEIESSLHPRAQRRLIRDLASVSRDKEIQIILTTHSPYVLEELPPDARLHIFEQNDVRQIMVGVSPQIAMTKMDDILHPDASCTRRIKSLAHWLWRCFRRGPRISRRGVRLRHMAHRRSDTSSGKWWLIRGFRALLACFWTAIAGRETDALFFPAGTPRNGLCLRD